jgi:hypothetical protein
MILPCFPNSLGIWQHVKPGGSYGFPPLLECCRNIPDWKKFLSVKENKQALINFFGDFIVKFNQSNPLVPPGNLYYISGSFGNSAIVKVVSDQEVFDCPDLYSIQEEAD